MLVTRRGRALYSLSAERKGAVRLHRRVLLPWNPLVVAKAKTPTGIAGPRHREAAGWQD